MLNYHLRPHPSATLRFQFSDGGLIPARAHDTAEILRDEELPVEIAYEDCLVSQFPVGLAEARDGALVFAFAIKHTDCLAKDVCVPQPDARCAGGGCC